MPYMDEGSWGKKERRVVDMEMPRFDALNAAFSDPAPRLSIKQPSTDAARSKRGTGAAKSIKTIERHILRRAKSEAALENALDWHLERDCAHHVISFGDVDSLSFLKHILRAQPLEYVILSTWCMAMPDCEEIEGWLKRGVIGRLDLYVGEIFQNQYGREYAFARDKIAAPFGGRVAVFRNHSKVMAGFGKGYDFAVESSANINTNPRTENTVVTTSRDLALFYKDFFDGIKSFNRDFDGWTPYALTTKEAAGNG